MTPLNAQPTSVQGSFGPPGTATRISTETVVCGACGCRLTVRDQADDGRIGDRGWYHFAGQPGRDARGCTVGCVESPHSL
jgi:hypothetical protein